MTEDLYVRFIAFLAAALLVPGVTFALFYVSHPNMTFWRSAAVAKFCMFVGSLLSALRDVAPDYISILGSNILITCGYFLTLKSVRQAFEQHRGQHWDLFALIGLIAMLITVFTSMNSYENRVIVVSLCISGFSGASVIAAYNAQKNDSKTGQWMIFIFAITNAFVASARGLAATNLFPDKIALTFWDPVFFVWSVAATFLIAIALFTIGNASIQAENATSIAEKDSLLTDAAVAKAALEKVIEDQRNLQKLLVHEFKRPVSSIYAILDSSTKSNKPNLDIQKAEKVKSLSDDAVSFLNGLAAYDDISGLLSNPNREIVSIDDIAKDIVTKWEIKPAVMPTHLDQNIYADPLLLDIAIGNLVENAQKFGKNVNAVKVSLFCRENILTLAVEDDGDGVPFDEQPHIWKKFYKSDKSKSSVIKGCGLGLFVVDSIARVHEGHAYVSTHKPNVICIDIPLIRAGEET